MRIGLGGGNKILRGGVSAGRRGIGGGIGVGPVSITGGTRSTKRRKAETMTEEEGWFYIRATLLILGVCAAFLSLITLPIVIPSLVALILMIKLTLTSDDLSDSKILSNGTTESGNLFKYALPLLKEILDFFPNSLSSASDKSSQTKRKVLISLSLAICFANVLAVAQDYMWSYGTFVIVTIASRCVTIGALVLCCLLAIYYFVKPHQNHLAIRILIFPVRIYGNFLVRLFTPALWKNENCYYSKMGFVLDPKSKAQIIKELRAQEIRQVRALPKTE